MRTLALIFSVALPLAAAASAQSSVSESDRILAIEARWNKAVSDRDPVTIGQIISEDFLYITPTGKVMDRAAILKASGDKEYKIDPFKTEEVQVRFHGDTAVVTGRFTQTASYKGQTATTNMRYTDVWVREGNTWRAISAHSSVIR